MNGITYSAREIYSPTYRINSCSVFDSNGSSIFPIETNLENVTKILALIASKFLKFCLKNFCGHTIASEVDELKEMMIYQNIKEIGITSLINKIIAQQKSKPRYDYASHEQIEIDKLVYEAYGLTTEDV